MKSKRHQKIIELITAEDIDTQEGILKGLRENGFDVTQATVSRDIKELQLIKTLSADGKYKYTMSQKSGLNDFSDKYFSILSEAVISMEAAGNMVVIKCHVGMAQAACACLDKTDWSGVVGTLAGDDTIFAVIKTEKDVRSFVKELSKYIQIG